MPERDERPPDDVPTTHLDALRALQEHMAALPLDGTAVEQLAHLKACEPLLNDAVDATVAAARTDKCSWQRIGEALHMRRQSAQERWGPKNGTGGASSDGANGDAGDVPGGDVTAPKSRKRRKAAPGVAHLEARLIRLSLRKRTAQLELRRSSARSD